MMPGGTNKHSCGHLNIFWKALWVAAVWWEPCWGPAATPPLPQSGSSQPVPAHPPPKSSQINKACISKAGGIGNALQEDRVVQLWECVAPWVTEGPSPCEPSAVPAAVVTYCCLSICCRKVMYTNQSSVSGDAIQTGPYTKSIPFPSIRIAAVNTRSPMGSLVTLLETGSCI